MALLIDTDLLIDLQRGDTTAEVERLLGDEDRALSVITVSELLHGVNRAQGAIRARRRAFVEHLIAGIEAIPITEQVARVHADIWADLSAGGETIGAHDLWIAATAMAHGLGVATRPRTFSASTACASSRPRPDASPAQAMRQGQDPSRNRAR